MFSKDYGKGTFRKGEKNPGSIAHAFPGERSAFPSKSLRGDKGGMERTSQGLSVAAAYLSDPNGDIVCSTREESMVSVLITLG